MISELTYSPDGSWLAVGSSVGVWLYDTETHEEIGLISEDAYWSPCVRVQPG